MKESPKAIELSPEELEAARELAAAIGAPVLVLEVTSVEVV